MQIQIFTHQDHESHLKWYPKQIVISNDSKDKMKYWLELVRIAVNSLEGLELELGYKHN